MTIEELEYEIKLDEYKRKTKIKLNEGIKLKKELKERYKDKLPPMKCIADEIWLYCKYLFDNIDSMNLKHNERPLSEEGKKEFYDKLEDLYQSIRGETFYQGTKTSSVAGGIFYITTIMKGICITQPDISEKIHISKTGLRHAYRKLLAYYKKTGQYK